MKQWLPVPAKAALVACWVFPAEPCGAGKLALMILATDVVVLVVAVIMR